MKIRKVLSIAVASAICASLMTAGSPVVHAAPPSGYTLAWYDEFDGAAVDTTKWNYRTDVKHRSSQKAENVSVSGGNMIIALKKENDRGASYTGGGLISRAAFRYGYYEARIKMNTGSGWHNSFWAQYGDGSTTFPPKGGQR